MRSLLRATVVILAVLTCVSVLAQNAVGKWIGRVDLSAAKPKDAKEKTMIDTLKKEFVNATATLSLKKGNMYHMDLSAVGKNKPQSQDGRWTQVGHTVTITDAKGKIETMTVSSDGRKMILTPRADEHAPAGLRMVFVRS